MKLMKPFLLLSFLAIFFTNCKKYNNVDNSSTVKTPYTLYIGGAYGTVNKTNDALYFPSLFYTDDATVRQILVADSVICYIKSNFYYSQDDGKSFPMSYNDVVKSVDSFHKYYIPNISLFDIQNTTGKRYVYLCGRSGLQISSDLGKTFTPDTYGLTSVDTFSSITQLQNGELYGTRFRDSLVFRKENNLPWAKVVVDTPFNLPYSKQWYISHTTDTLMAIDFNGTNGVYYSTTQGTQWHACKQLPTTHKILFGNQVFGQFYVGLDSAGLYKFNGNQFTAVGKGIPWYAKIYYVIGKTVRYRTDVTRNFYFCATDQGLYMSETQGLDWRLIKVGAYSTLR